MLVSFITGNQRVATGLTRCQTFKTLGELCARLEQLDSSWQCHAVTSVRRWHAGNWQMVYVEV